MCMYIYIYIYMYMYIHMCTYIHTMFNISVIDFSTIVIAIHSVTNSITCMIVTIIFMGAVVIAAIIIIIIIVFSSQTASRWPSGSAGERAPRGPLTDLSVS